MVADRNDARGPAAGTKFKRADVLLGRLRRKRVLVHDKRSNAMAIGAWLCMRTGERGSCVLDGQTYVTPADWELRKTAAREQQERDRRCAGAAARGRGRDGPERSRRPQDAGDGGSDRRRSRSPPTPRARPEDRRRHGQDRDRGRDQDRGHRDRSHRDGDRGRDPPRDRSRDGDRHRDRDRDRQGRRQHREDEGRRRGAARGGGSSGTEPRSRAAKSGYCPDFNTAQGCDRGARCGYKHPHRSCGLFGTPGGCPDGDRCTYAHPRPGRHGTAGRAGAAPCTTSAPPARAPRSSTGGSVVVPRQGSGQGRSDVAGTPTLREWEPAIDST